MSELAVGKDFYDDEGLCGAALIGYSALSVNPGGRGLGFGAGAAASGLDITKFIAVYLVRPNLWSFSCTLRSNAAKFSSSQRCDSGERLASLYGQSSEECDGSKYSKQVSSFARNCC